VSRFRTFLRLSVFISGLLLAACAPARATEDGAWGAPLTVGYAEQSAAPAMLVTNGGVSLAWIGSDDSGVHQDAVSMNATGLSARVVLPLPPKRPYGQRLFPAGDQRYLLWLDTDDQGQNQLFSAFITQDWQIQRGPSRVTDTRTVHYDALPVDSGLWAVASGGNIAEPSLTAHFVDSVGRPREDAVRLVSDADWPVFAQTSRDAYLFWLRGSDGAALCATFANGRLGDVQQLSEGVHLNPGDRLDGFYVGMDTHTTYLFRDISRADGSAETWLASGEMDGGKWPAPAPLRVGLLEQTMLETGFNSGLASRPGVGDRAIRWAVPLKGVFDYLPVAAAVDGRLYVLYFQDGAVVAMQDIAPAGLIGAPALAADRDLFLYLAWAQPVADGRAALQVVTPRAAQWAWVAH
jgi:hypothetical protein